MNKAFYAILFFSIVLIFSVSVYLINRKAPSPPPLSNQPGFTQIYTPKLGGRVFTAMNISGENCESDGIRFNIANEHTLVDRESTWIFTLNNNPINCTDKPWWAAKIGSVVMMIKLQDCMKHLFHTMVDLNRCALKDHFHNTIHVAVTNMLTFHQCHKENQLA